jgi:alcohol dehydrogenase (cytochrome c)
MNWFHQYVPGDMWDYDEIGTHILIDGQVAGQAHKLITHAARNGWTKGIDQKTGMPVDYDPAKDIQVYSGLQNPTLTDRTKRICPRMKAATITGRRHTAPEPSSSTFHRDRPATKSR